MFREAWDDTFSSIVAYLVCSIKSISYSIVRDALKSYLRPAKYRCKPPSWAEIKDRTASPSL